tara:strand:- start:134 stop:373 length:240 start_codon:yes stop_codon:yes gene_type:complete
MKGIKMDKFKNKKVCRVCKSEIVFKKDAYWKPAKNGMTYPLNIHYGACSTKVYLNGDNAWEVSRQELTKIDQLKLALFK